MQLSAFCTAMEIYVAPDGDDSAAGTFGDPLATIQGARDKIREIRIDTTSTDGANELTLAAWIYPNVEGGYIGVLSTSGDYFALNIVGTGNGSKVDFRADNRSLYSADNIVPIGQWSHLVGVWRQGQIHKLYVNGSPAATNSSPSSDVINPDVWYMATDRLIDNRYFNGQLKGVHVWTRILSEPEISAMAADDSLIPPTPVMSWQDMTSYDGMAQHKVLSFNPMPPEGIMVNFRDGKYFVDSMTVFESQDSGEPDNPIIYQPYPGETARFIGGLELDTSAFVPVTSSDLVWSRLDPAAQGNLMKLDLSPYGISDYGLPNDNMIKHDLVELSFNETIMELGRWPNDGANETTVSPNGDTYFTYTGTRPERWQTAPDPYVRGQFSTGYYCEIVSISSIDTSTKRITLTGNPANRGCGYNKAWSAFNLLEEIDIPGEYYIDKTNDTLYFWPPSQLAGSEALLSTYGDSSNRTFDIDGTSNVHFKNLTFEMFKNRISRTWSSDWLVFDSCIFRNSGEGGMHFGSTTNLVIKNSKFYALGTTCLTFGDNGDRYSLTPANIVITNNYFNGTGRWKTGMGYAPPVWLYSSNCGFTISHNLFEDTRHVGLCIFGGNLTTVEYNRFHHCAYESDDCAAIYTAGAWGRLQGCLFRYNEFYNTVNTNLPGNYGNHGVHTIYYDGVSGGHAFGNIAYNYDDRVWFNNFGRDCVYKNNISVNGGSMFYAADPPASSGCDYLASIAQWDYDVPGSAWYQAFPWLLEIPNDCNLFNFSDYMHTLNCSVDTNLSWQTGALSSGTGIPYYSFDSSTILEADPKFYDEENLCFAVREDSPAYTITGFQRIPWELIGRYDSIKAIRPVPPIDAEDVVTDLSALYWAPALDAGSHKVYLSKHPQEVIDRLGQAYAGEVIEPNLIEPTLSQGRTYYWAVDEYDSEGTLISSGDLWSFTVAGISPDINRDGDINLLDISELAACWLESRPAEGVYAWWKLDDGGSITAIDSSGNGYDATLSGPVWIDGTLGGALEFDGINDMVSVPALNLNSNTITITAWIKREGLQDNATSIFYTRSGNTPDAGVILTDDGRLWGRWNGTWQTNLQTPDSEWVFIAYVVTPSQRWMYLHDGIIQSETTTGSFVIEEFDGTSYLGWDQNYPTSRFFKGSMDDIRIYNSALSISEIDDIYHNSGPWDCNNADIDNNNIVNLSDLEYFILHWLSE